MGNNLLKQFKPKLLQQNGRIQKNFPGFVLSSYKNQTCVWYGSIQPTVMSEKYKIKIIWKINTSEFPTVWVESPPLRTISGEKIPHRYKDGNLCLFLPKKNEWNSNQYIADTIIPWTSLWLFYYEAWLITGEWFGGGIHPDISKK